MTIRVSIVDESSTIHKIFQITLAMYDVRLQRANSLAGVVEDYCRGDLDVAVLDAGFEAFQQDFEDASAVIKPIPRSKVIVLIGKNSSEMEQKFRDVGMIHFLRKPFQGPDISRLLVDSLGKPLGSMQSVEAVSAQKLPPIPTVRVERSVEALEKTIELTLSHEKHPGHIVPPPPEFRSEAPASTSVVEQDILVHVRSELERMKPEIEKQVRQTVIAEVERYLVDYCDANFQETVVEGLSRELQRLAKEQMQLTSND